MPKKDIEKQIEDGFVLFANTAGVLAKKFIDPGRVGAPDRICLCPNAYTFFIEFKAPGEKADPMQELYHSDLRKLGYHVYVCDDLSTAKRILNDEINVLFR